MPEPAQTEVRWAKMDLSSLWCVGDLFVSVLLVVMVMVVVMMVMGMVMLLGFVRERASLLVESKPTTKEQEQQNSNCDA